MYGNIHDSCCTVVMVLVHTVMFMECTVPSPGIGEIAQPVLHTARQAATTVVLVCCCLSVDLRSTTVAVQVHAVTC